MGTGDDISLDLPAYFVGKSTTLMQVINKSNKKEHHAKYGLHFLNDLVSTIELLCIYIYIFIYIYIYFFFSPISPLFG